MKQVVAFGSFGSISFEALLVPPPSLGLVFSITKYLPICSEPLYSKALFKEASSLKPMKAIPLLLPSGPFKRLTLLIPPASEKNVLRSSS